MKKAVESLMVANEEKVLLTSGHRKRSFFVWFALNLTLC